MAPWLIARAVAARVVVLAVAAALIGLGAAHGSSAETDVLPEFSPPYVEVQTEALGLSAEEVEQLITAPMENLLLNGVAFLDDIRSESVNGLSSITLIFEPGTDLLEARQVVQERLTQVGLLAHLTEPPAIVQPISSTNRVMVVGFSSTEVSPIAMSVLARWTIRPRLLGVPGVANIAIFGQRERQLQVQVDPRRLAEHGVTLQEVINTSGNSLWVSPLTYLKASAPGTGGFVDTPASRLEIRHVSPITAPEDLRQVALEQEDGTQNPDGLTLGDVATVVEDHQPLIGDAVIDDGPGLVMVIEKFPGANTVTVTEGIEEALSTLAPGLQGVTVETELFRPATFVEEARDNFALTLGLGLLLAVLLVLLVLLDLRATLVVVASTAVSLLTSLLLLDVLGVQLDSLALAGLALATGVVVQDAVADVVHVARALRDRAAEDGEHVAGIIQATWEARRVMGYATVIVLLAPLPLLVVDRLSQAFFQPAIVAFAVAVVTSLVVSLTVTPALGSLLLRGGRAGRGGGRHLEAFTRRVCDRVLGSWRAAGAVLTVGVLLAIVALPLLHATERPGLLPEFEESELVVSWRGDPGVSREAMTTMAAELGAELRDVPGVENVGGHVGRAVLSDRVNGIGAGELWVRVDPGANHDDTVARVRRVAEEYDAAPVQVRSFLTDRVEASGALMAQLDRGRAVRDDEVIVRIYGEEFEVLAAQADEVEAHLSSIEGVEGIRIEMPPVEPNLEVRVDLEAAERHGLKPGDIRRAATTLATGLRVGSLFEEQKVFDVVVTGERDYFTDPARIGELLIDTPDGGSVRLDEVAEVAPGTSFSIINRESVSRRLDLVVDASGDRADVADQIEERLDGIDFPLEYHAEVLEEDEGEVDLRLLALAVLGVLVAGVLLLQVVVRSWKVTLAVAGTVAFSLVGSVAAAVVTGADVTIGTVLAFVLVLSLAVRSSLTLVDRWGTLRDQEEEPWGRALVIRGVAERSVPLVLTGAATAAVLLPAAILGGPGLEVVQPMAVVVLGGVLSATLAPLVLLPPLYLRWGAAREPDVLDDEVDTTSPARG